MGSVPRRRVSAAEKSRELAAKRGKPVFRFTERSKEGYPIYTNPKAVHVDQTIRNRGERKTFSLKNVEWIRVDAGNASRNSIGSGGFSYVVLGRIKFAGVSSSRRVAIKSYRSNRANTYTSLQNIMKKIDKLNVPHPKWAYIPDEFTQHIVMEPFLIKAEKRGEEIISSKFIPKKFRGGYESPGDVIDKIDLRKGFDKKAMGQALEITATLAKGGVYFGQAHGLVNYRADVFAFLKKRNGDPKVYVQDIDTMIERKDHKENWVESTRVLLRTASVHPKTGFHIPEVDVERKAANEKILKQMIEAAAKKHGFA